MHLVALVSLARCSLLLIKLHQTHSFHDILSFSSRGARKGLCACGLSSLVKTTDQSLILPSALDAKPEPVNGPPTQPSSLGCLDTSRPSHPGPRLGFPSMQLGASRQHTCLTKTPYSLPALNHLSLGRLNHAPAPLPPYVSHKASSPSSSRMWPVLCWMP